MGTEKTMRQVLRRREGRSWFDKLTMSEQTPLILSLSKDELVEGRAPSD
jgi:hypothetical protein